MDADWTCSLGARRLALKAWRPNAGRHIVLAHCGQSPGSVPLVRSRPRSSDHPAGRRCATGGRRTQSRGGPRWDDHVLTERSRLLQRACLCSWATEEARTGRRRGRRQRTGRRRESLGRSRTPSSADTRTRYAAESGAGAAASRSPICIDRYQTGRRGYGPLSPNRQPAARRAFPLDAYRSSATLPPRVAASAAKGPSEAVGRRRLVSVGQEQARAWPRSRVPLELVHGRLHGPR